MKAFVTGASSFVGSEVCRRLLADGFEVWALVRPNSPHIPNLPVNAKFTIVWGDLENLDEITKDLSGMDIFFHFAWGGVGAKGRADESIQIKNLEYSLKAIDTAHRMGAKCFVFPGSQAEYGIMDGETTEETPCNPNTAYGKYKLKFGQEGAQKALQSGIKFIHLRIFSVYGEHDHEWTLVNYTVRNMLKNEPVELSSCKQYWNYVYVEDAAKQIELLALYALNNPEFTKDLFNIASEDTRPLWDFVQEIARLTQTKSEIHRSAPVYPLLSLQPRTTKTRQAIHFISSFTFAQGVERIIKEGLKHCISCNCIVRGGVNRNALITIEQLPASAQNIPTAEELNDEKGITLTLFQCPRCGLVQLDIDPVSYYKDVIRAGGGSSTMRNLRLSQYKELIEKFNLEGKKIIEVGCGKGEFLSILAEFNVQAEGVENSPLAVQVAQQKGLNVFQGFVENAYTRLPNAPYDAFVQFNFLEHQPHPTDMLQGIYANLTPDGVGLVTVPAWEYLVENESYYEIIRDHLAYYSFPALKHLLEGCGFEVAEHKIVNRDTHAVLVRKRPKENIQSWKDRFKELKSELNTWVNGIMEKGGKVAVWGASHQGFTLIPTMGLSDKISYIIDSAPFKQGRFAPSSHVKIVSPEHFNEEPVQAVLIVAPGYTEEIYGIIRQKFGMDVQVATVRSNHLDKL